MSDDKLFPSGGAAAANVLSPKEHCLLPKKRSLYWSSLATARKE